MSVNSINPKKLLNSKWTAVKPIKRAKHFSVAEVEFDEDGIVIYCTIEAIISNHSTPIDWRELKDMSKWLHGWK